MSSTTDRFADMTRELMRDIYEYLDRPAVQAWANRYLARLNDPDAAS